MSALGNSPKYCSVAIVCAGVVLAGCSLENSTAPQARTRVQVRNGVTTHIMSEEEVESFIAKHGSKAEQRAILSPRRPALTEAQDPPNGVPAKMTVAANAWVGGFTGEIVGSVYTEGGTAVVQAYGSSILSQGRAIPNYYDDPGCYSFNSCAYGRHWAVNCQEDTFTVQDETYGQAAWATAYAGPSVARDESTCSPRNTGTGGDENGPDGSGGSSCNYYLVQVSYDDGQHWETVSSYAECNP